ncbi:MAG: menaquinone biosynthetic enzyme MqnA/MqnD family protein [Bacteroidia bacterium]|jgi:chorismate dehydratase
MPHVSLQAMTRVAIVNYLNTTPFLHGIRRHGLDQNPEFEFQYHFPANCARALIQGDADIGLIPVAVLPQLSAYEIIGNTCIGADGRVESVLLVCNQPLEQITTVWLDYQSKTSVALCKILMRDFWNKAVYFRDSGEHYLSQVGENEAAVVIGDRAFDAALRFKFSYDLAEAWKQFTDLPFVFALWISKTPVLPVVSKTLNDAFLTGILHREEAAKEIEMLYPQHYSIRKYLTQSISYTFDEQKKKGLETFLSLLSKS